MKPLYKQKGEKRDPNNYRGISLLPALYKIFIGILYTRLIGWIEENSILPETQFGFRKGRSTVSAVNDLKNSIQDDLVNHGKCYPCFVDYQKAFDSVDRNLLIAKLQKLGLRGRILGILHAICQNNLLQVVDGSFVSGKIVQNVGVAQGDKLSPLLFSLFIADLSKILQETGCHVVFYADDLVFSHRNLKNVKEALDRLANYCHTNKLTVNIDKTKALKFRKGGKIMPEDALFYRGIAIEYENTFCYLGVNLTPKLACTEHLNVLINKTKSTVFGLQQKVNLQKVCFNSAQRLLEQFVLPAGTYSLNTFLQIDTDKLDDHYNRICGIFWKKWAGISVFSSTGLLLENLYFNDYLGLRQANTRHRRIFALYYTSGCHNNICTKIGCYKREIHDIVQEKGFTAYMDCVCRLCKLQIVDEDHIRHCISFPESQDLPGRLINIRLPPKQL